jgi:hypothetical protein
MKPFLLILFLAIATIGNCQDSIFLKVHFLYGSTPKKMYKTTDSAWFGGLLGGHAGLACGNDKILHFAPKGKFHKWPMKQKHGRYIYGDTKEFYEILGGSISTNKQTVVSIPISAQQKIIFDSIALAYMANTPYDYAFTGFRCGSATYEILAQMNILPNLGHSFTKLLIFYPRKLRKKILKLARKNNWKIEQKAGTEKRNWERDV